MSSGPDVSHLTSADAVVALRSFPRRFGALLEPDETEDPGVVDLVVEEVDRAGRDLAVLGAAVEAALVRDDPVLHPAVLDASAREYPDAHVDAEAALDLLRLEAEALADRIAHVGAAEWGRRAKVAGASGEVTALDVLREAVRTTATHLRTAEQARHRG